MGNKQGSQRRRSQSDADDRGGRRRSKPTRSQSTSQIDGRNMRQSMPDLGGAVPYKARDDAADVDVKLYRSYGNLTRPKSGALLGQAEPDIKYYRKSTEGLNRYQSLPRNYGRSKSTSGAVPNGRVSDYPELSRRSELPYDPQYPPLIPERKRSPPESESGRESQRTSKRVSAASSMSSLAKAPVCMEDFPTTAQIKRKIKCFEDQFCRSLVDKYAGLADTLQLSALAIALARGQNGNFHQVSLLDYLDTDAVPLDLVSENPDNYILLIPEALFHGLMHVRRDKISELDLWTNLARDLVTCVGIEAGNEISRMYEYQIVLLTGDSAVRVLADHAAACVIEYIKRNTTYLDRNSAILGVVKGTPSATVAGSPKYLSVILGNRELKWEVQEVLKKPGLKKDLLLFSADLDGADMLCGPWDYFTSKDANPQLYGYRGLLLEWDWVNKTYKVNKADESSFPDDISDPMDYPEDFHRMFYPYKRLFSTDFMAKYCHEKQQSGMKDSLAQYLNDIAGDPSARDHIHPVYRPLGAPKSRLSYASCNLDNVDLTRAQLRGTDLSQTSVRNSRLLMTDMEGATFTSDQGHGAQMRGADVSYTTLAESTVDQQTLDGIVAKHVVVMRPKHRRRKARSAEAEPEQTGLTNGHSSNYDTVDGTEITSQAPDGTTPVTTKHAKTKRKVPKTLNVDDITDGTTLVNGNHGERSPAPEDDVTAEVEESLANARQSYISDSQGNLLDIEQAKGEAAPKKRKVKKKRPTSASGAASGDGMIEQKQKRIKERKSKKVKKRVIQAPSTPTEPIPETPVFVEQQEEDSTKTFFTESQPYIQQSPVLTQTVLIQRLDHQQPAPARKVNGGSDHGSHNSGTDYNILDVTDNGDVPPARSTIIQEETTVEVPEDPPINNNKTKKTKGKDKNKTKNGDKKKTKKAKGKPEAEVIEPPPELLQPRPHSVAGTHQEPEIRIEHNRPVSAFPDVYVDADASLSQKSPGKSLSTTDIHHHHQMPYTDRMKTAGGPPRSGLHPRMTKSLSHHGTLGVGPHRLHNRSMDSQGIGLLTARQIYGLSKEDIEFITRSQIFNMIKGLQISNIESNLPDLSKDFIGRTSERDALTEMLGSSGCLVTVTGCYGNGKSALATAVAMEIQKKFVVPMVIDVRGCSSVASIVHRMMSAFGLHFRKKELNLFYNWLNCHEQRLFFIFDNLNIPSSEDNGFSDLIDGIMTNVKNVRMMFTSRRNFYKGTLTHEVYRLGDLHNSSTELLKKLLPDLHEEGFEILADVCANNLMMLGLVSKTFMMDEIDSGKLFEEMASSTTHDLLDRIELALFDITEDEAELDILRRLTCGLLRLLDNIPLGHAELLVNASHFTSTFDVKTLAALAERKDIDDVKSALDELAQTGIVVKAGDRYLLPFLVKFVNQSKLPVDGSATLDYYRKIVEDLKLVCAQYHSKRCGEAVKTFEDNYDNYIEVLCGIIEREDVYELCPSFASLEYGLFLGENLPEDVYINFYESFAQGAEDNDDVAKQCRALCCLVHKLVLDEQMADAKHSLDMVTNLIKSRPSEISEMERAFCLRCQGKVLWEEKEDRSRAISLVKKALDLYKLSLGSRDLQTIFTNELYAWMLTRKESHQTARHFYNISDLFVREMMDEHPLLIEGYDCRRSIWDRLCLFQRATDTAKKAVEVSKKFYGEHPMTAKMMTHLCESIIKRGSLNDAISAGIDALAIRSKVLGDHRDTGQSYKTLAYLMLRSGQYDEAARFGQNALDIFDKVDTNEQLKVDTKNIIAQARYRLEYKSHVYVELQGRDAKSKHLSNGSVDESFDSSVAPSSLDTSRASTTVSPISTTV